MRTGQHHVGQFRGLGQHEVADSEEIQPSQPLRDGQLVGLLAVLPATLPVALPGEDGEPGTRPARQAQGQRQVDEGQRGVGAVAVLLGSPGGQHHGRRCLAEQPRGLVQLSHRNASDPLHTIRPVRAPRRIRSKPRVRLEM